MANNNEYYEVEVEVGPLSMGIEDKFYLQDLQQRKLFVNDEIDAASIPEVVKNILQYNSDDSGVEVSKRKPILLYITSNGGSVDYGFELIDAIEASKTPVYTINLGFQYSMGFLIGLAGHKRFAMPNAKFLVHDGSNMVFNSGAKAQDQMEFQKKVEERIKDYIISHSKMTEEEYDSKFRVEWYMFADEAKEKGFVDYIVGKDCEIDDIVGARK